MIIVKKIGIELPDIKVLETCAGRNRDGIGIAYASAGQVIIKKDFTNVYEFNLWVMEHISIGVSAIIHFRLATNGLNDIGNRHPFPVIKDMELMRQVNTSTDLAVAHNGVISGYDDKVYSDTQLFVSNILSHSLIRDNLGDKVIQELIREYMGYGKLAFIDGTGRIRMIGTFEKDHGLYYSNEGYKEALIPKYLGFIKGIETNTASVYDHMEFDYCNACYQQFDLDELIEFEPDDDDFGTVYLCQRCSKFETHKQRVMDTELCTACFEIDQLGTSDKSHWVHCPVVKQLELEGG